MCGIEMFLDQFVGTAVKLLLVLEKVSCRNAKKGCLHKIQCTRLPFFVVIFTEDVKPI
jgi:hypothetical protein